MIDAEKVKKLLKLSKIRLKNGISQEFLERFQTAIKVIDKIKSIDIEEDNSYLKKHAVPLKELRGDEIYSKQDIINQMPYTTENLESEKLFYTPKTIPKEEKK